MNLYQIRIGSFIHTWASMVFHRRLTSGGIFNNRLLFSPLFSGNFVGETRL